MNDVSGLAQKRAEVEKCQQLRPTTQTKMTNMKEPSTEPLTKLFSKPPVARFRAPGLMWSAATRTICFMYTALSKLWIGGLNKVPMHNRERFWSSVYERKNRGLITICNHSCCIDDPLFLGILKWRHTLKNPQQLRWSLAAHDICFQKHWHSVAMALGKILPTVRGDGIYQPSMDFCVDELNDGKWVHIFPEGKINMEKEAIRLKWGVGRLIADCSVPPMVLLFHHIGFDNILPNTPPYIPQIGQKASVYIGELLEFGEVLEKLRKENKSAMDIRKYITDQIQQEMAILKQKAEDFHNKQFKVSAS